MSGWVPHQFSLCCLSPSMSQYQLQATFWTRAAAFPVTERGIPMKFRQQTSKYGRPQNTWMGTKNKPFHWGPAERCTGVSTLRCRCCLRAGEEDAGASTEHVLHDGMLNSWFAAVAFNHEWQKQQCAFRDTSGRCLFAGLLTQQQTVTYAAQTVGYWTFRVQQIC